MTFTSFLVLLVPSELTQLYIDRLRDKVYKLKIERDRAADILRDVEEKEYTIGFRGHLVRKIDDADAEQRRLQEVADYLSNILDSNR